ncbi:hypothetical protein KEM55_003417 [Ascosphaera atra]|nr:hypothetical protein KEM55_003417 [Ascosphaera atra]
MSAHPRSVSDTEFLCECLKQLTTIATVDVRAVARALKYSNPASVANRVRDLKRQHDLKIMCTNSESSAKSTPARRKSPAKKGASLAQTASGNGDEEDDELPVDPETPSKRARTVPREIPAKEEAKTEAKVKSEVAPKLKVDDGVAFVVKEEKTQPAVGDGPKVKEEIVID